MTDTQHISLERRRACSTVPLPLLHLVQSCGLNDRHQPAKFLHPKVHVSLLFFLHYQYLSSIFLFFKIVEVYLIYLVQNSVSVSVGLRCLHPYFWHIWQLVRLYAPQQNTDIFKILPASCEALIKIYESLLRGRENREKKLLESSYLALFWYLARHLE